jgi:hypothetical protein
MTAVQWLALTSYPEGASVSMPTQTSVSFTDIYIPKEFVKGTGISSYISRYGPAGRPKPADLLASISETVSQGSSALGLASSSGSNKPLHFLHGGQTELDLRAHKFRQRLWVQGLERSSGELNRLHVTAFTLQPWMDSRFRYSKRLHYVPPVLGYISLLKIDAAYYEEGGRVEDTPAGFLTPGSPSECLALKADADVICHRTNYFLDRHAGGAVYIFNPRAAEKSHLRVEHTWRILNPIKVSLLAEQAHGSEVHGLAGALSTQINESWFSQRTLLCNLIARYVKVVAPEVGTDMTELVATIGQYLGEKFGMECNKPLSQFLVPSFFHNPSPYINLLFNNCATLLHRIVEDASLFNCQHWTGIPWSCTGNITEETRNSIYETLIEHTTAETFQCGLERVYEFIRGATHLGICDVQTTPLVGPSVRHTTAMLVKENKDWMSFGVGLGVQTKGYRGLVNKVLTSFVSSNALRTEGIVQFPDINFATGGLLLANVIMHTQALTSLDKRREVLHKIVTPISYIDLLDNPLIGSRLLSMLSLHKEV